MLFVLWNYKLNNVTGQLNMTIFKAMTIEMNEMSETQKTATSAALDTCIASDLKLPTPPPNMDPEPLKEGEKLQHFSSALYFP